MPAPTLLDIAITNGSDPVVGLIDEAARACPEITGLHPITGARMGNAGAARTIRGINYKTLVRTAVPTGGFRPANKGTAGVKGTYENRLFETFILNPRWECDKAVADRHEDGADAFIAMEGAAVLEGSFQTLAKQFYYGTATNGDASGHPGLIQTVDSSLVVDAGGTTDDVASSVWAVRWGTRDVCWVWGNNGALALSDVWTQAINDADGNRLTMYLQEILAYPGLQVASKFSVGRIKKLTTDNGKGLTDALIADLLSKYPVGKGPDVLYMSRRSLQQLQKSRTATNATGAPAPFPTESHGIPIAATESIVDTEKLAS